MAKKNKDIDITIGDAHLEVKKDENSKDIKLDTKNLDVEIHKDEDSKEVKIQANGKFLEVVGKILGKLFLKKIK